MAQELVAAVLARNEAGRFLRPVLERLKSCCDTVLVLDDRSTDDTPKIAHELGCKVRIRQGERMWGLEAPARAELWDWAAKEAKDGWVLVCDADMELVGDPRPLLDTWDVNSWAWTLFDLWDDDHFREDEFWRGHQHPRVWMVRASGACQWLRPALDPNLPHEWKPVWPDRRLHSGHIPINYPVHAGIATNLYWKHFAYMTPALRKQKHAQYLLQAPHLTEFERQHANSILDYDAPTAA